MTDFDGLAFPVITVRLGNNRGNGTMATYADTFRARLSYDYSGKDGVTFAALVARAVWDKYVSHMQTGEYPYTPDAVILVPGNPGPNKGYAFTAVPTHYFA